MFAPAWLASHSGILHVALAHVLVRFLFCSCFDSSHHIKLLFWVLSVFLVYSRRNIGIYLTFVYVYNSINILDHSYIYLFVSCWRKSLHIWVDYRLSALVNSGLCFKQYHFLGKIPYNPFITQRSFGHKIFPKCTAGWTGLSIFSSTTISSFVAYSARRFVFLPLDERAFQFFQVQQFPHLLHILPGTCYIVL